MTHAFGSLVKRSSAEYAALLETPHGSSFEANVGAPYIVKQYAYLLSYQPPEVSDSSGGAAGASEDTQGPDIRRAGLDCLPYSGEEPATLQGKLDVLKCLVFETPHRFWVEQANDLKRRIERMEVESGWVTI